MTFKQAYKRLEEEFRLRVEEDKFLGIESIFLPNIEPTGPVDYVLVGMEPSREVRAILGCPLGDSTPVPQLKAGEVHSGSFEAPCGLQVAYATPITFPSMAHYRWHSIFDHLDKGECQDVDKCAHSVMASRGLSPPANDYPDPTAAQALVRSRVPHWELVIRHLQGGELGGAIRRER